MLCSVNSNEENYKLNRFEHNRSSSSSMSKTFQVPCPGQIAPESARDSYDAIYYAKVMYHEVGRRLSEVKKMKVCSGLSYEKLHLRLVATLLVIKISLQNLLNKLSSLSK